MAKRLSGWSEVVITSSKVIWQQATSLFYHIREVAALVAMLVLRGAFGTLFWGKGCRRGPAMVPFRKAMVVSSRLSIVTIALSLTIRQQFALERLQRSNQQVSGSFLAKT